MREYRRRQVTVDRDELVSVHCDWCRQAMPPLRGAYNAREFELIFKTGYTYPEGGSVTGWQVQDLCDNCVDRLRGLLVEQGINVTKVDEDY